jgi:hypothetical protein
LWFGTHWPDKVMGSQDAAVSLLLLLPGLVAGAIALRREFHLVEQLLLGVRLGVVAMLVTASLAVASLLQNTTPPGTPSEHVRRAEAALSADWRETAHIAPYIVMLLMANVVPKPAVRARRRKSD